MDLSFLTREVFDALIIAVIIIGLALAGVRLYSDYTRYLRLRKPISAGSDEPEMSDDDTQPNEVIESAD